MCNSIYWNKSTLVTSTPGYFEVAHYSPRVLCPSNPEEVYASQVWHSVFKAQFLPYPKRKQQPWLIRLLTLPLCLHMLESSQLLSLILPAIQIPLLSWSTEDISQWSQKECQGTSVKTKQSSIRSMTRSIMFPALYTKLKVSWNYQGKKKDELRGCKWVEWTTPKIKG